jgi:simple sugar transport system permease protein
LYLAGSAAGLCGIVALLVITFALVHVPPINGLYQLWSGAFGNSTDGRLYPISATLVEAAPLLLASLSICIAWRAGLFSIGAQGQLLMGALAATITAHALAHLPPAAVSLSMLIMGSLGGALWAAIAGLLRIYRNVQEVISTIMLNYVALYLVSWIVLGPLRATGGYLSETDPLPDPVMFARLIPKAWSGGIQTSLHTGVILALFVVPLAHLILFYTRDGFNIRVLGANSEAARVAKLPVKALQLRAMALSGAIAGLAGVIQLLGSATGSLSASFAGTTGFTAIPTALLGGLHPAGALVSSLFFAGLNQGCRNLEQNTGVSSVLIYVIQASAVLAVVAVRAVRNLKGTRPE